MPKGPQGQRRPADVIGNAITIGRIATGELSESEYENTPSKKGQAGGLARAESLSPSARKRIAEAGAEARWKERRVEMSEQSRLMRALFEHSGRTHVDIKFLRGSSNNVTEEDVCREANSAIFQIESGLVEGDTDFHESFKQVDVAELVKNL